MNLISPRAAGAFLVGGLIAATASAQNAFTKALPADTIALFSFPDISKSIEEMQGAPIAKMWHEGEVQDFLADAITFVKAKLDEGLEQGKAMHEMGMLPFNPTELTQLRLESLSVALTSLDIQKLDNQVIPKVGLLIHADLGKSAQIWQSALDTLAKMAVERSRGEVELKTMRVGEAEVTKIAPPMEGFPMGLHMSFFGDSMVIGTVESEVSGFLTSLQEGSTVLAGAASYQRCAQRLNVADAEAEAFVRPNGIIDFLMKSLRIAKEEERDFPPQLSIDGIDRALTALGVRSLDSLGGTSTYENGRCVSTSYAASPEQNRRGIVAMKTDDVDLSQLRWVPKDAASLSIGSMNVSDIYTSLVDAMKAYDEDVAKMMLGKLAEMEEKLGISLKDDIFGAFGTRYATWQLPMASFTSAPEMAIIVEMKNQEGFLNSLKRASQLSEGKVELEENERRGIKVYQLIVDYDFGGGGFNPMASFTPTFAFKDGNLVLAFSTGDIKRAFKRMDREDDPSGDIRSNAEFAPYLQQLPRSGLTSLSFRDWKAEFESYYQIGTTVLAFVPLDDDIPVDLSLLPDASTLTQHLCGSMTWSRSTPDGFVTKSVGPWGPETMALLVGAIAGGAATFAALDQGF